jgi:hypothetical protein
MPSAAALQAELDALFSTMQILRASPEASVQLAGRSWTQKNLQELQRQYDWVEGKLAAALKAASAAVAAGGGAGVIEFGGPTA